ncbi:unnamed protein product [Toxocara canis]|uniref:RAB3GAP2_N domain-containing protein n=1 Tax=Toxocara canis TaxID=6265 RepID=A0A183VB87_TOXCA|nr:unnamed protein product [Toxocara canis]
MRNCLYAFIRRTVEWLDDACRQPTISFTSRFPSAFPLTDAASLNPYLSTFNPHDPLYVDIIQRHLPSSEHDDSTAPCKCKFKETCESERRTKRYTSVDKWSVEKGKSIVLIRSFRFFPSVWSTCGVCWGSAAIVSFGDGVISRCKLRDVRLESLFRLRSNLKGRNRQERAKRDGKVVAHPVLPLMLTASQFGDTGEKMHGDGRAELILWKINPVGPLCKSGGVRELARMTARSSKSFTSIAWIPAILPSCTLGSVCNSPSSCFVASENGGLQVYQAVVDAAGLLAEIYASEMRAHVHSSASSTTGDDLTPSDENNSMRARQSLKETFNVASTQSTAKPGCVLRLTQIADAQHDANNLLLLHVFNERLMLGSEDDASNTLDTDAAVIDRTRSPIFSDRYFVVVVERNGNTARIKMWSLDISSQQPQPIKNYDVDERDGTTDRNAPTPYYRAASPVAPSAAQLILHSQKVCDQQLPLPDGVHMLSIVPAAGHLPSSNLYPACRAPYVLLSSCSDEHIRFWKCVRRETPHGTVCYLWQKWGMISDIVDSDLEMDGQIFSVSSAHSGRFACAYMPEGMVISSAANARSVKVGVFECESSGGVEWLREDTLLIDNKPFLKQAVDSQNGVVRESNDLREEGWPPTEMSLPHSGKLQKGISSKPGPVRLNDLVRIDWVSTEDGSHILTVGVGSSVYMYTQVSQGIAQRNIVMMKEHETHRRAPLRKASSLASPERISTRLVRCSKEFLQYLL